MAFSWDATCIYVISMPHSASQRATMRRQFAAQGLSNSLRFWHGLRLNATNEQAVLNDAAAACVVPVEYTAPLEEEPTGRLRGIVGSTLAHLLLLRHAYLHDSCRHVFVLADDVVLKPDFRSWVTERVMAPLPPTADFVNLAVVRAFGTPVAGSAASRVSAHQRWPQWDGGAPRAGGELRSPNLLVSSYVARRASLPLLLASFRGVEGWRPQCSIDQVLARIQYALHDTYTTFVVDAPQSHAAHCAVAQAEVDFDQQRWPWRHQACAAVHPELYGRGSRSLPPIISAPGAASQPQPQPSLPLKQPRRGLHVDGGRRLAFGGAAAKRGSAAAPQGPQCNHSFRVPGDRLRPSPGGRFTTLPLHEMAAGAAVDPKAWPPVRGRSCGRRR